MDREPAARRSPVRRRRVIAAACVSVALLAGVALPSGAHAQADCPNDRVCLYEHSEFRNMIWRDRFVFGCRTLARGLWDRASSWVNTTGFPYVAWNYHRWGPDEPLWVLPPWGSFSRRVNRWGNDRADRICQGTWPSDWGEG
jgi:hypothetical protein